MRAFLRLPWSAAAGWSSSSRWRCWPAAGSNLRSLAIDAVPDISPKQVMILTEAQGLGPLEVERLVTIPVETQMAGLPQMKDVRSTSRFGLSAVYVTFEDGADVQTARAAGVRAPAAGAAR